MAILIHEDSHCLRADGNADVVLEVGHGNGHGVANTLLPVDASGNGRQKLIPIPDKNLHQLVIPFLILLRIGEVTASNLEDQLLTVESSFFLEEIKSLVLGLGLSVAPLIIECLSSI